MKKKRILIKGLIALCSSGFLLSTLFAQVEKRKRPEEWKNLVTGARFRDRFLAMPSGIVTSKDNWGASGVMGRYVDNGIEDKVRSYWGGNIIQSEDGRYHLYVCGWPESSEKGHMTWPNSIVFHSVSHNAIGPYKIKDTVGPGHNPEIFRAKNGQYAIYVIGGYYLANSYNGPWEYKKFVFDPRDRPVIEGLSNLTFAKRADGSNLMICRGGGVWFSRTGLSPYRQVSDKRVYPAIDGRFEDPVVWRDNVQYNLIVNDWLGRIAYYLRSKDGINWVTDPGEAYTPGIALHEDGTSENWFKYERIKVLQDQYGRAYQANFAVIDVMKSDDKATDRHSSKNIAIPLNRGMLMEMKNRSFPGSRTKTIRIKIFKESGFEPAKVLDLNTLRFGANQVVNYGGGSKVTSMKKTSNGIILSFENRNHGLTKEEFAPKLIGKTKSGKMVFGYTRVSWVDYKSPILSAKKPTISLMGDQKFIQVQVDNFGEVKSKKAALSLYLKNNKQKLLLGKQVIPSILPYGSRQIKFDRPYSLKAGQSYSMELHIQGKDAAPSTFNFEWKVAP